MTGAALGGSVGFRSRAMGLAVALWSLNLGLVLVRLPQLPASLPQVAMRQAVLIATGSLVCAGLYVAVSRLRNAEWKFAGAMLLPLVLAGSLVTAASVAALHYAATGNWHADLQPGRLLSACSYWTWFFSAWVIGLFLVSTHRGSAPSATAAAPSALTTICVTDGGKRIRLRTDEIEWLQANGDYVLLHMVDRHLMIHGTLASFERRLSSAGFVRVHRSSIVRRGAVRQIERLPSGNVRLHLASGASVTGSRQHRRATEGILAADAITEALPPT